MAVVPPDVAGDAGGGVAVGGGAVPPEVAGPCVGALGDEAGDGGGVEGTVFDDALPPGLVGDATGDAGGGGGAPEGVLVASSPEDTAGWAGPGAMLDKKNHSTSPAATTTATPSASHSLTIGVIKN
ncbi:MAG: hypothetical protein AAB919_00505 [Patescibacteria group bacterium]